MILNGHNDKQILKSLKQKGNSTKIIIANTIKGFGIKLMENNNEWHHKFPKDTNDLEKLKKMVIY